MWSCFSGSDVAKFESELLAWLGTISAGEIVEKEQLEREIDVVIAEKKTVTSMLGSDQFTSLKKNLKQKKQIITAPARVEHHPDDPHLGHAQHKRQGSEGHAGILL